MKKYFLYPALALALVFSSCNDGENFQGPPEEENKDPKSTNEYFNSHLEDMLQEFTFDNDGEEATIETDGGMTITIQPGTFTRDGEPVEGKVDIQFYEMLSMSSIAFSGTNTNYAGGWRQGPGYLKTDGFFHISATAGGKEVDQTLALDMKITMPRKMSDNDWTELWAGNETTGDKDDQFAWDDLGEDQRWWEIGVNDDYDFEFDLGKLGWCNCDVLAGGQYTVTVSLTGEFGKFANYLAMDGETYVFYAAKGTPIIAQLYTVVDEKTVKSYDKGMPASTGRLFAFSIRDGVYTYAEQEITIDGDDLHFTLDMEEVDKEYIDKRISTLDNYK